MRQATLNIIKQVRDKEFAVELAKEQVTKEQANKLHDLIVKDLHKIIINQKEFELTLKVILLLKEKINLENQF